MKIKKDWLTLKSLTKMTAKIPSKVARRLKSRVTEIWRVVYLSGDATVKVLQWTFQFKTACDIEHTLGSVSTQALFYNLQFSFIYKYSSIHSENSRQPLEIQILDFSKFLTQKTFNFFYREWHAVQSLFRGPEFPY